MKNNIKAFSLLELSVALLVLGLIVGSVTVGSYLTKQAKVNKVIADFNLIQSAIYSFENNIYTFLPGDIILASQVFAGACLTDPNNSANLCNGNGNGIIDYYAQGATNYEDLRAFQHLALAGLLPGSYTGYEITAGSVRYKPGVNHMLSESFPNAGYFIYSLTEGISSFTAGQAIYSTRGVTIQIAGVDSAGKPTQPVLTPKMALQVDRKLDDGNPSTGSIMAYHTATAGNSVCVNNNTLSGVGSASYVLTDDTASCLLAYWYRAYNTI